MLSYNYISEGRKSRVFKITGEKKEKMSNPMEWYYKIPAFVSIVVMNPSHITSISPIRLINVRGTQ